MKFRKFGNRAMKVVNEEELAKWTPRTEIGRKVYNNEISDIDDILSEGRPILEYQIIDKLVPNMEGEVLELRSTQRVTDNGRKPSYRAVVLVGDKRSHVGIGVGKHVEVRQAVERAMVNAKRNMIKVTLGSGSWEDTKGHTNSIPIMTTGRCGSVRVTIKPAPRGVGIVANKTVKKVLSFGGVSDAWTKAMGQTSNTYNLAMATLDALKNLNSKNNTMKQNIEG